MEKVTQYTYNCTVVVTKINFCNLELTYLSLNNIKTWNSVRTIDIGAFFSPLSSGYLLAVKKNTQKTML